MSSPLSRAPNQAMFPPGFRLVPTAAAGGFPAGGGGGGMAQAGGAAAGCGPWPGYQGPNGQGPQNWMAMFQALQGGAAPAPAPGGVDMAALLANLPPQLAQALMQCCNTGPCNTFFSRQTGPCRFPLGFTRTTIAAGANVGIIATPQMPYQGQCLIIPSDIAGQILVTDIKVGQQSQLVGTGPLPGRMFSEASEAQCQLDLDPAQVNQPITLFVTNTSGGNIDFTAGLIGWAWKC